MKDVLKVVLAIIIVVLAWKIFKGLIGLVIGVALAGAVVYGIMKLVDGQLGITSERRGTAHRRGLLVAAGRRPRVPPGRIGWVPVASQDPARAPRCQGLERGAPTAGRLGSAVRTSYAAGHRVEPLTGGSHDRPR